MSCKHDLAERETACADGMCPLCMVVEIERLQYIADTDTPELKLQHEEIMQLRAEIKQLKADKKALAYQVDHFLAEVRRDEVEIKTMNLAVAHARAALEENSKECPVCKTPARRIWMQEHAKGCAVGTAKPLPFDDI